MFNINRGKGFSIEFSNGYTVSVQFGAGNYCSNRDVPFADSAKHAELGSSTAECAVIDKDGGFITPPGWVDEVKGWMEPSEVVALLAWAESKDD